MNEIIYTILYLIVNLFGTYTLSKVFKLFFNKPIRRLRYVYSSYALFFIVNSACFLLFNVPIINVIANLILYIIIASNYKAVFWKKALYIFLIFVAFVVLEQIAIVVLNAFGMNPLLMDNQIVAIWVTLFVNIIILIISSIILRKKLLTGYSDIPFKRAFPIYILSVFIIALGIFLPPLCYQDIFFSSISMLALCAISVFMYIFIDNTAKMTEEKSKKEIFANQNEHYKKQIELLDSQQNNIKTIRHNIKGQIETIYTLIDENKIDSAKEYIGDLIDLVKASEKKVSTNIPEFDSLINYKINIADRMGINLLVSTRIEDEIKIRAYDYISVLDNLIENAIEAVKDINPSKREIQLVFGAFKGLVFIKVENDYDHQIIVDEDIFLTTKNNTENHGYGIEYIKSIVEKYNGKIDIDYIYKFTVKIFMQNSHI